MLFFLRSIFITLILFNVGCRSSEPVNKAILSKDKPSKEILLGYKDSLRKLERTEKRRLRRDARMRAKRNKKFENNTIR